ncbi:hypothetical protein GCM10027413_25370 [Conyzicola nivalis]|uniref:Uncharacterized protein n=1 Tax=Conyzicola nivalis TaxID=1477021 RepID=A0A916WDS1_9MICO|nr:hypothetical protein GCM10010979_01240 [Conyzicola nivalis]
MLVSALAASGCAPEGPKADEKPSPTATPLFASDEEALAAAEEAYAAYVQLTDAILAAGGSGIERLGEVAAGQQLRTDADEIGELATLGYRTVGQTTFSDFALQGYDRDGADGIAVVTAYVCEDVSGVDVLDANGISVVEVSRPDRAKYEVTFDSATPASSQLLVSLRQPWVEPEC